MDFSHRDRPLELRLLRPPCDLDGWQIIDPNFARDFGPAFAAVWSYGFRAQFVYAIRLLELTNHHDDLRIQYLLRQESFQHHAVLSGES